VRGGYSLRVHNCHLHLKGPTDALSSELVFEAGAKPDGTNSSGPVVVVVKKRSPHGGPPAMACVTVHPQGSVVCEMAKLNSKCVQ